MVGFRLGEYKAGSNEVVEPNCLKNISKAMKSMVKVNIYFFNHYFAIICKDL